MTTIATLFSGGEGVGVGAQAAGFRHLWGIEINDTIAQVARDNGFYVVTADVTQANPADFERPDVLHASPPCPSFSCAKQGRQETGRDIALAQATARFIEELRPRFFTLENVYMYRKSASWQIIASALDQLGYWYDLAHVNAADFGVPQTRKRMIVRATLGQMVPPLPPPGPWIGWYQAIEDLLPGLPDSKFANWQLKRMPVELRESLSVDSAGFPDADGVRVPVMRKADQPINTIVANFERRPMRAFLATGQYGQPAGTPGRTCQTVSNERPSPTVTASTKGDWRSAVHGRVVRMTPRCLARFQAFPDEYKLPDSATLATRVIGNAVPPLLYQKLISQLLK